jgi:hypothetical protein
MSLWFHSESVAFSLTKLTSCLTEEKGKPPQRERKKPSPVVRLEAPS